MIDVKAILKGILSSQNLFILLILTAILGFVKLIVAYIIAFPILVGGLLITCFISILIICVYGLRYHREIGPDPNRIGIKAQIAKDLKSLEFTDISEKTPPIQTTNIICLLSCFFDNPAPTGIIDGTPKQKSKDNIKRISEAEAQKIKEDGDKECFKERARVFESIKSLLPNNVQSSEPE
ncbi:hypothetical protein ACFL31_01910 [Candidatus Margulisiibacteriota bacterium]